MLGMTRLQHFGSEDKTKHVEREWLALCKIMCYFANVRDT